MAGSDHLLARLVNFRGMGIAKIRCKPVIIRRKLNGREDDGVYVDEGGVQKRKDYSRNISARKA